MTSAMDRISKSDQELKIAVCASTYFALNGVWPGISELISQLGFGYYEALMEYHPGEMRATA